jgi:uncharacterized membrane-anchored protein YjiN (DUF445 family)
MKLIALGLLAAAAVLYVAAVVLERRNAGWGYVAAFAEAAMVGAIADWFAVVALFRHPLGLPIPHTAIIPSNKERIGRSLADFICANFFSTGQVLDRLLRFDAAARLAGWLAEPRHAEQFARHFGGALVWGLGVLDDERVRAFFRTHAVARLERVDASRLAGQLLELLTSGERQQVLLDGVLQQLAALLDRDSVKAAIAGAVAQEVKYLRKVGLDQVAGRYATEKLAAAAVRLVDEIAADPVHPLRLRLEAAMSTFIGELKDDPAMAVKGEAIKQELLAHPAVGGYLQGLWSELVAWLQQDLAADDSALRGQVAAGVRVLGTKLAGDEAMRGWIDEQIAAAAPRWIERYREDVRRYIVERVDAWDTAQMTDELERNIGRDLQFIRINGTLVGGLVGLSIYAATQWLK